ncbi:16784_t:CDS:2, partial [Racocetra fulgida]
SSNKKALTSLGKKKDFSSKAHNNLSDKFEDFNASAPVQASSSKRVLASSSKKQEFSPNAHDDLSDDLENYNECNDVPLSNSAEDTHHKKIVFESEYEAAAYIAE